MNRLTPEKRAQILHLLCEGMSIRAITRLTDASKNTVAKLLADVGRCPGASGFAGVERLLAEVDGVGNVTQLRGGDS